MKRLYSIIISITAVISVFSGSAVISNAANNSNDANGLKINNEYKIEDADGLHIRYVVMATNTSGKDLEVFAVFNANASNGQIVKTVSDDAYAVKSGQSFMLYGQFKNSDIEDATDFSYDLKTSDTSLCRYDAVSLDVAKAEDNTLSVTGTNYSTEDIGCINVRTVFFKDGAPVAFDTVNIGDSGYLLRSGSSNTQELGMLLEDYDNYVVTYVAADDM
ncbi:hypothetical protein [Butyrivibrio sp. AE3004]|uniref:hypothetical protein n=1 Tax=Butyrivibrio sp. AE3004 TaxID=1506994 RepID=UPI000493FD34|nr:hypothetical protein [Butyrivibrio sp. AE3004]